jgi:hypothetical protein
MLLPIVSNLSVVIAGLDPAIHQTKRMDARVKPAHDVDSAVQFIGSISVAVCDFRDTRRRKHAFS